MPNIEWVTTEIVAMHNNGQGPVMAHVRVNPNGSFEFTIYDKDGSLLHSGDSISMGIAQGRCERYLRAVGWSDSEGVKMPLRDVEGNLIRLPKEMR
jgi:hypothetical protein